MRNPSRLFSILFPCANRSSSANRRKFWTIRQYFDKKGVLILSAKFLTKQFPNEFSNVVSAKNFLKRTLRRENFNPFETDKYIIKTNVDTYDGRIPADYLQALSLVKNPDTLNFYMAHFVGQRGWYTTIISIYSEKHTKKIIKSISKQPLQWISPLFKEEVNSNIYNREEKAREKERKIESERQEKKWREEREKEQKKIHEELKREQIERGERIDAGLDIYYKGHKFKY